MIINATCVWAGGIPDVRFHNDQNQNIIPKELLSYDVSKGNVESLVDRLFPDHGPDPKIFDFVFKDGNHFVSFWNGFCVDGNLYVEIPDGNLPAGSRECFVALLEYAEDTLGIKAMFLCIPKARDDRAEILRTFMFIGFEIVHLKFCSFLPPNDKFIFMAYSLE